LHSLEYSYNALTLIIILNTIKNDCSDFDIISGFKSKSIMQELREIENNENEYFFESVTISFNEGEAEEVFEALQEMEDIYSKCINILIYDENIITINLLTVRSLGNDEYQGCEFIDCRDTI
jgi:hypothetical protein